MNPISDVPQAIGNIKMTQDPSPLPSGAPVAGCSIDLARDFRMAKGLGIQHLSWYGLFWPRFKVASFMGWGRKKSGQIAEKLAQKHHLSCVLLEEGFLRSFASPVEAEPSLSWVVDDVGIYYDATCPSLLEQILQGIRLTYPEYQIAEQVLSILRHHGLSKYNHGVSVPIGFFPQGVRRVLLVDQTAGDSSIKFGGASIETFQRMMDCAINEEPSAEIWVKTHPDVLAKKRKGCIDSKSHPQIRWIGENVHPHDLLPHFDRVFVVTSQMGLDALLLDKPVTCFGQPFYSGWGLTDDRNLTSRRDRKLNLSELVYGVYLRYTQYIHPINSNPSDFFVVAAYIARQKNLFRFWLQPWAEQGNEHPVRNLAIALPTKPRLFCFGFRRWKRAQVRPFFGAYTDVQFVDSLAMALKIGIQPIDQFVVWSSSLDMKLSQYTATHQIPLIRVEDGFIRSVGLGSDFVAPLSLVFDRSGIYFDSSKPSDLEKILQQHDFMPVEIVHARELRFRIIEERVTKYNVETHLMLNLDTTGRTVILVPGQVEGDASIRLGGGAIRKNRDLITIVRKENPDAFIIYKPHPDVQSGNRAGVVTCDFLEKFCDYVAEEVSILSCIDVADQVHTITSLSGFDALLRGKKVVTYGMPFYAGWGLTQDRLICDRRTRTRTIDELVAATLVLYPRYRLPGHSGFVSVNDVVDELLLIRKKTDLGKIKGTGRTARKWMSFLRGMIQSVRYRFKMR